MRIIIKTRLLDKEIVISEPNKSPKKVSILGLASMNVSPLGKGIGRLSLELFKEICKQKRRYGIVGFCLDDVLDFYLKCGWFYCGKFEDLNAISSVPLQTVFTEKW